MGARTSSVAARTFLWLNSWFVCKGANCMSVWQKKTKYFVKLSLSIQKTIKSWKIKIRGLQSSDPWRGTELYWARWWGKRWSNLWARTGNRGAQFLPDTHCFPGSSSETSTPNLSMLSTGSDSVDNFSERVLKISGACGPPFQKYWVSFRSWHAQMFLTLISLLCTAVHFFR